jgi:hypothetical protein
MHSLYMSVPASSLEAHGEGETCGSSSGGPWGPKDGKGGAGSHSRDGELFYGFFSGLKKILDLDLKNINVVWVRWVSWVCFLVAERDIFQRPWRFGKPAINSKQ